MPAFVQHSPCSGPCWSAAPRHARQRLHDRHDVVDVNKTFRYWRENYHTTARNFRVRLMITTHIWRLRCRKSLSRAICRYQRPSQEDYDAHAKLRTAFYHDTLYGWCKCLAAEMHQGLLAGSNHNHSWTPSKSLHRNAGCNMKPHSLSWCYQRQSFMLSSWKPELDGSLHLADAPRRTRY